MTFVRYLLVGGAGFCVDLFLTLLFVSLGFAPSAARIPAIAAAMAFTWLANRQFTFRVDRKRSAAEAVRYFGAAAALAGLNWAAYGALVAQDLPVTPSVVIATAFQALVGFQAYRMVLSRKIE